MITWIQKTFQQHFRTVFAVLLILIIVAFVFTIGAAPGVGNAGTKALNRPFFGLNLGAKEDQEKLFVGAQLSASLQGYNGADNEQLYTYALQRYASLALADQLGVPSPTPDEITDHLKTLRAFAGETGEFDAKRYQEFRDQLKLNPRLTEAQVFKVIADDVRAQNLQKLLGGPGYVTGYDVRTQLSRADATWTLAIATVDYASFNPTISINDVELTKYFEDNAARYELPAKVSVSALEIPTAAFVSRVSLSDAEVRAFYDANPARFPKPTTGTTPTVSTASPDADFAIVRPQVEAALRDEKARLLAMKAASDIAVDLYENKVPAANVAGYASSRNLAFKTWAPFSRQVGPAEAGGSPQVAAEAFKLSADRAISDPLTIPTGAAVLVWNETIAARKPLLVEVRAKVAADYTENEKRKRFTEAGRTLRGQLDASLKAGNTLAQAIAALSGAPAKIEVKTLAPFTLRQPPQDLDYAVYGSLQSLEKGGLSEMAIGTDNKGVFVYAADKKLPDLSETSAAYTEAKTQISQFSAVRNSGDYLREIVQTELAKSEAPAR